MLELEVDRNIAAGTRYPATLTYTVEGEGEIDVTETCFAWSGEGPYCFRPFRHDREAGEITTRLITRNPNRYLLSGSVKYLANGHRKQSNAVSAAIDVD